MKKSKVTRSLLAAVSVVALSAVMYGCVHSGDSGPSVSMLDLSGYNTADGATVEAGTYSIDDVPAALASAVAEYSGTTMGGTGDMVTVGGYTFTCVAGPCSVSVSDDESRVTVEGTINVMAAMAMPPEPEPEPEPTDLENAQDAAKAAADAAMTASDNAAMAASGAADATMNLATMQTGAMAMSQADKAKMQAEAAMAAYMDAKAASDRAAAATDTSAAIRAQIDAEAAQADAEAAAMKASEYGDMAMASAMGELMIDGTMKSVGETSINAMAGASSVSTGSGDDARTVVTGLIKSMNPMATGDIIEGQAFAAGTPDDLSTAEDESTADTPYRQAAAERTFAIGKVLDSSDDMARLMLVTDYAGKNLVNVYSAGATGTDVEGTKAGYITIDDTDPDTIDTNNTALRSEGMFVPVTAATAGTLAATDEVAANAEPVEVFSYVPPTGATGAGIRQYATLTTTSTTGDTTTYTYASGHGVTGVTGIDGPDVGTDPDESRITAGIPGPVAYKHLHFGVWAALGDAAANGDQDVAGLGIGFVQSIGDGMTGADMPTTGDATYNGNWVATVQSSDATGGTTSLDHGAATLTADFDEATIEADLDGLAMLEGAISGGGFSGMKASGIAHSSLASGGSFEGSFSGGFYGSKAAEAGGIFDFTSGSSGAFRGAFGGAKEAE